MRILVIGGSGRTGSHVIEQALGHGHDVRALQHVTPVSVTHPRLEVVSGSVLDGDAVAAAVEGVQAVAFAIGAGGGNPGGVYSEGVGNVLYGMALHGATRLAAVSAAGVFARKDPRISMGFRLMIATALRGVYNDMERMEQRIAASGVEWTIIRPVGLTDEPATGRYRISGDGSMLPKASRIARADVAALALKALESGAFDRRTLLIAQ